MLTRPIKRAEGGEVAYPLRECQPAPSSPAWPRSALPLRATSSSDSSQCSKRNPAPPLPPATSACRGLRWEPPTPVNISACTESFATAAGATILRTINRWNMTRLTPRSHPGGAPATAWRRHRPTTPEAVQALIGCLRQSRTHMRSRRKSLRFLHAGRKRFVDRTKHFVVVTKYFCYPYINKWFCWYNIFFSVQTISKVTYSCSCVSPFVTKLW